MKNKSIFRNFAWQTLAQTLKIILPIITSPYLARMLGGEGVGIYAYTSSIAAYYCMFAQLGIENYGRRLVARKREDKEQLNQIVSDLLTMHIILCIIMTTLYYVYALFFAEYKLIAIIQGLTVISMSFSISWIYNGFEEIRATAMRFLIVKSVGFALLFFVVKGKDALINYSILMAVSALISELLLWFRLGSFVRFVRPDFNNIRMHIPKTCILFIPVALQGIYTIMDKIMLGMLIGKMEVGYYEYAEKALVVRNIISSLGVVMLPRIANLYEKNDYKKINDYIVKSLKSTLFLAIGMAFGIAVVANDFAPMFWGQDFAPCGNIIMVLSFTTIFWAIAQVVRTQYLIPTSRDKKYVSSVFIGAVLNVILNYILIAPFGGIGAAIATLITEAVVCIYQLYVVRKELDLSHELKHSLIYVLFGTVMFVVVSAIKAMLPLNWGVLFLEIFTGASVFMLLCILYWKRDNDTFMIVQVQKLSSKFVRQKKE